jgi:hypothetical protein
MLLSNGAIDQRGTVNLERFAAFRNQMTTFADSRKAALEQLARAKTHNKKMTEANKEREAKISDRKARINAELEKLLEAIKAFTSVHPDVLRPA